MRKKSYKFNKKRITAVLLSFAVILMSFIFIEIRVKRYSKEMSTYYCRSQLSNIMNDSVISVLEKTGADYSDMSVDIFDENGRFISSELCAKNVNILQGMILSEINKKIKELSVEVFEVSSGTLSGLSLLNGLGPNIKIRFVPVGNARAKLNSSFESAGINQVCHKIFLDITAEVRTVCPSGSEVVSTDMTCVLAENIISGEVPDGMILKDTAKVKVGSVGGFS